MFILQIENSYVKSLRDVIKCIAVFLKTLKLMILP